MNRDGKIADGGRSCAPRPAHLPYHPGMSAPLRLCVILPAAGSGSRLGAAIPKTEFSLGGKPVFAHALETLLGFVEVAQALVCVPPARLESFARDHGAVDALRDKRVRVIAGSPVERYDTIRLALAQVAPGITHVAVHDAARPLLSPDLIMRLLMAARHHGAVLPALPAADTLRRGSVAGKEAQVLGEVVPRTGLLAVQTPQVFARQLLERAYANLPNLDPASITDDAGLVEALGQQVFAVMGEPRNLKLTHPADWEMLQALELASRVKAPGVKAFCCR